LYVPSSLAAGDLASLLVALHGGLGSSAQFATNSGFDELAEANGFIVVYPDGIGARPDGSDEILIEHGQGRTVGRTVVTYPCDGHRDVGSRNLHIGARNHDRVGNHHRGGTQSHPCGEDRTERPGHAHTAFIVSRVWSWLRNLKNS
jgi:hypothetical protein